MNKFRVKACVFIIIEILFLVCADIYIINENDNRKDKLYAVEISRIKNRIHNGEDAGDIDCSKYKEVVAVSEFNVGDTAATSYDYKVEQVDDVLYRFDYVSHDDNKIIITVCFMSVAMVIVTIILMIYFDRKILAPFNRMTNLTTELAKGNLTVALKQEKSKYFGKFVWGLDILREKLEEDKAKELELLKEKETLILSISHDIKTPLSAIELYSKAIKTNLYENEADRNEAACGIENNIMAIKDYMGKIRQALRDDLLVFTVDNTELYLLDVVDEIKKYYNDKCDLLHIGFTVDKTDNCLVKGDKDRIVEVVQNIMENAIKYGDGESISITFSAEEDCILLTVSNSGCSLKDEELVHVFDSFYRGSNSTNISGSGLGLYICKELMHKMDGECFAKISGDYFNVTVVLRKA